LISPASSGAAIRPAPAALRPYAAMSAATPPWVGVASDVVPPMVGIANRLWGPKLV
jgi:hypothetical protein